MATTYETSKGDALSGLNFSMPSGLGIFSLVLSTIIVSLTLYGIRTAIEDGRVTNDPEQLRQIMFGMFSLALAVKFSRTFGMSQNRLGNKILMVALFYVPIGLMLAAVSGVGLGH